MRARRAAVAAVAGPPSSRRASPCASLLRRPWNHWPIELHRVLVAWARHSHMGGGYETRTLHRMTHLFALGHLSILLLGIVIAVLCAAVGRLAGEGNGRGHSGGAARSGVGEGAGCWYGGHGFETSLLGATLCGRCDGDLAGPEHGHLRSRCNFDRQAGSLPFYSTLTTASARRGGIARSSGARSPLLWWCL